MKVAIIGSRDISSDRLAEVSKFVKTLPSDTILVSGGARGVDQIAELSHSGRVFSFRTYKDRSDRGQVPNPLEDYVAEDVAAPGPTHYGVEFWDYQGESPEIKRFDCFFADAKSALFYRNWLIAKECDELYA